MRLDALDSAAQDRKRALSHHRSLYRSGPLPVVLGDNRKPAHLFMICSNLKLTSSKESIGMEGRFFVNNSNEIEGTL